MRLLYPCLGSVRAYALVLSIFAATATAQQVATPVLNPGAQTSTSTLDITIVTATSGADIRYTTNGTTPSSSVGTVYTGPVTVSSTQTIKAIAYKTGLTDSNVATATYTIVAPPSITSISPTSGSPGTSITVTGTAFGSTRGAGAVWLGSTLGTVTSWSDTQIIATVASNATAGVARVLQNGTWSNGESLDISGITIDSLTPDNGLPGTSVTIAGSGFGSSQGTSKLLLGTDLGTITSWSDTQIVATVATGARSGGVQVLKAGRTGGYNELWFTVTTPEIYYLDPEAGVPNTTITVIGANFGSTQGTGTLQLGSANATVLTWTDTEITAVVATGAKSGIARVQQGSYQSNAKKFSVPDGLGDISSLTPDIITMAVGETRAIQALDEDGDVLTGLTWASSNTGVVSLSASDPPILTAVAAGHVTITAGSASADVTVVAGELPLGTVLWSNTVGGQSVDTIAPAVPSPTGVADVFAIHSGGESTTVHAITTDGITAWTAEFPSEYGPDWLIPNFQGGLIDVHYDGSGYAIAQVDGLTGELGTAYSLDTEELYSNGVAVHPDGTVFALRRVGCSPCDPDRLIGIDPATGMQKFSIQLGTDIYSNRTSGGLIIAGDGNAYVPYIDVEDLDTTVHWSMMLLRVTTSGTTTRIPIKDWYFPGGEYVLPQFRLITNAETGVLLTWSDGYGSGFGMAVTNDTSVTVIPGRTVAAQSGPVEPVLQAQDGSFIGNAYSDDGSFMIAFDATGAVRWSVANLSYDAPAIASANGSTVMESGLVYDADGAVSLHLGALPRYSWKGAYRGETLLASIIPPADLGFIAQTKAAVPKGNLTGNGFSLHHHTFGIKFCGTAAPMDGACTSAVTPMTFSYMKYDDIETQYNLGPQGVNYVNYGQDNQSWAKVVKGQALAQLKRALDHFPAVVALRDSPIEIPLGPDPKTPFDHTAYVSGAWNPGTNPDPWHGQTPSPCSNPCRWSWVYYPGIMFDAQRALGALRNSDSVYGASNVSPTYSSTSPSPDFVPLLNTIGYGIGTVAVHEIGHQLELPHMHCGSGDSNCLNTYEHVASDPAKTWFWGHPQIDWYKTSTDKQDICKIQTQLLGPAVQGCP